MQQKNGGTMSNRELANILKRAVESMEAGTGEEANGNGNGWAKEQTKPVDAPFLGVSVPIKVETPMGSVRCYLSLPPEVVSSPETLMNAIKQLVDMGIPVDIFSRDNGNGWKGGSRDGGSWRQNGGYGGNNGFRGGFNGGYNGGGFRSGRW